MSHHFLHRKECLLLLLNFSHPITDEQNMQIEARLGASIERVVSVPTAIDHDSQFTPQVVALADACDLSPDEWQTLDLLINPPGFAPVAIALIAEIHGRRGAFPAIVRIRPVESLVGTRFEVAEIINVQSIRDGARARRWIKQE
jgi:hypothetical protein